METIKITKTNHRESIKYLTSELTKIIDKNKILINNISTNGNLASVLQDDLLYSIDFEKIDKNDRKSYLCQVGVFYNLPLNVDTLQSWTINEIHLKKDEEIIQTVEIEDKNDFLI